MTIAPAELAIYLAYHAKSQLEGHPDVAVMTDGKKILGVGVDTRTVGMGTLVVRDSGSAVVNLIQGMRFSIEPNRTICTTYRPTEMCIGMAATTENKRIVFVDESTRPPKYLQIAPKKNVQGSDSPWSEEPPHWVAKKEDNKSGSTIENFPTLDADARNAALATYYSNTRNADNSSNPWLDEMMATYAAQVARPHRDRQDFRGLDNVPIPGQEPGPTPRTAANAETRNLIFMHLAMSIVALEWRGVPEIKGHRKEEHLLYGELGGNNIGSVLVDADDNIIGWGVNRKGEHRTYHGEVNAVQRWQHANPDQPLPRDCRLYTTLESCHMCAGMLVCTADQQLDGKPLIEVFYLQKDPRIENNALTRTGSQTKLDGLPHGDNLARLHGHDKLTVHLGSDDALDEFKEALHGFFLLSSQVHETDHFAWKQGFELLLMIQPLVAEMFKRFLSAT